MSFDYSGIEFVVFTDHALPADPVRPAPEAPPTGGVGTELLNHTIMRMVKWVLGNRCDCRKKAVEWDAQGIEWCEAHVDDELIPHLRATAGRFSLLWSEEVARRLIRVAIVRAKRKARAQRG